MNELLLCERCDELRALHTMRVATVNIGPMGRRIMLCEGCMATVADAVIPAVKQAMFSRPSQRQHTHAFDYDIRSDQMKCGCGEVRPVQTQEQDR